MDALVRPVARSLDIERPSLSAYVVNGEFVRIVDIPVDRLHFRLGSLGDSFLPYRKRPLQRAKQPSYVGFLG